MNLGTLFANESAGRRTTMYVGLNAVFCLVAMVATFTGPSTNPRTLYLCLLMAICSTPLLWMRELNGRYVLLCAFLAMFMFFYGALDFAALLVPQSSSTSRGVLSAAEVAVLYGAALAVIGYRLALAQHPRREPAAPAHDYPMKGVVVAGMVAWLIGTGATWIWQTQFQTSATTIAKDFGTASTVALVLGRMLQPLGTIMLAYALVITRSRTLLLVMIAFTLIQMVVGFVGDSKETAMRGVIIVILASFLLDGRVNKGWSAALMAFALLVFPIYQAYRAEVMQIRGFSRAQAATDIGRSFKLALSAKDKVKRTLNEDYKVPSFLERTALKPSIEMLVEKTGETAKFQNGYTLWLFFTGFVPRYFWPDKPDSSVGQLMNRQFHVSEDPDTYISATHLGEFYWNFGFPGVAVGMLGIGFMLGFINARFDLAERRTLTRLLVLITTIYAAVVRFEGSIALEYIVLVRSLVIIWVLHLLFARVWVGAEPAKRDERRSPAPLIDAPQLMR